FSFFSFFFFFNDSATTEIYTLSLHDALPILKESTVLALGGGTYAQPGCPEFLRTAGAPVLWLDSPVEVLLSRCMTMTGRPLFREDRKSTRLNSSHVEISYAVFCLKKKKNK